MKSILLITLLSLSSMLLAQETQTITELILGENVTWEMFMIFMAFGLIGLMTSLAFDIYSSGISGNQLSFKVFWQRNRNRVLLSLLVIVIAILFSDQLMNITMSNWSSFLAGFTADKLIENLMKRRRKVKQSENERQD